MPSKDHVHIYSRLPSKKQWRCLDSHCTHKLPTAEVEGKITRCTVCREREFILTKEDMKRKNPRCIFCSKTQKAAAVQKAAPVIDSLMTELFGGEPS